MTLTIDPTVPVELAAAGENDRRELLSGVSLQKHGRRHYLVATDSFIAAFVPVKNATGDQASTKDTIIPAATLAEHRKHLRSTQANGFAEGSNFGTATLAVDRDTVTVQHEDGSTTTSIEQRTIPGGANFPSAKMVIGETKDNAHAAEYGRIRVAIDAALLSRLARALGAEKGRGRNRRAQVVLDLPHDTNGEAKPLKPMRVYPHDAATEAFGVLMPVRLTDSDLVAKPCL